MKFSKQGLINVFHMFGAIALFAAMVGIVNLCVAHLSFNQCWAVFIGIVLLVVMAFCYFDGVDSEERDRQNEEAKARFRAAMDQSLAEERARSERCKAANEAIKCLACKDTGFVRGAWCKEAGCSFAKKEVVKGADHLRGVELREAAAKWVEGNKE